MDIYGCKNTHYSCYHQIFFIRMNQRVPVILHIKYPSRYYYKKQFVPFSLLKQYDTSFLEILGISFS